MKRLLLLFFVGGLSLCSLSGHAQKESKRWSFGFFSEGGLPLGDVKNTFKLEGGYGLRLSIHAGHGFVTLSGAMNFYIPKIAIPSLNVVADTALFDSGFNVSKLKAGIQIPVMLGYKYFIGHYFFVMGEVGYSNFLYYYVDSTDDNTHSIHSYGLTYSASAGFTYRALEIGVQYMSLNATSGTLSPAGRKIAHIGLRFGVNF